jgi:hypothetical protein
MDTCTESASSAWLAFARAVGLVRFDTARDTRVLMEDRVRGHADAFRPRAAELERQLAAESAAARAAMAARDLVGAREHLRRAQAARTNLLKVRNLLESLGQQAAAMDDCVINSELALAWRESAEAFSEWQRQAGAPDPAAVDDARQDLEVRASVADGSTPRCSLLTDTHAAGRHPRREREPRGRGRAAGGPLRRRHVRPRERARGARGGRVR